jgi:hypothetical protein
MALFRVEVTTGLSGLEPVYIWFIKPVPRNWFIWFNRLETVKTSKPVRDWGPF